MIKFKYNSIKSYSVNCNDLEEEKVGVDKLNKLIISIFSITTFIGPFINIFGINISNVYSLILGICVFSKLLKMKYKSIYGYIIFFFIMILYGFSTLIWGKYSNIGVKIIMPLVTSFIAMTYIAGFNEKELKVFLKSFNIFTIIILIIALIEIFTGKYMLFSNVDFIYSINKYSFYYPGVFFPNPNDLAQYLLVGFPLLAFINFERKKQSSVLVLLFLITIFILINTSSRISVISMIAIIIFYFMVAKFKKGNKLLTVFVIMCLTIILINILPYLGIDFLEYNIVNNFLKIDRSQGYFIGRETIYSDVFDLAINNIILGAGLGASYTISIIGTHNMFLFILADLGIIFTLGFAGALIIEFMFLFKYRRVELCGCRLNLIIISIFIIFPLFSSISSANEQRKIVWILLGIILSSIKNSKIKLLNLKQ